MAKIAHIGARARSVNAGQVQYVHAAVGTPSPGAEAAAEDIVRQACTVTGLRIRISANTRNGSSSVRVRKNQAAGSGAITIGAGLDGTFIDDTGSDSFADSDALAIEIGGGSGTGTLSWQWVGADRETSEIMVRHCITAPINTSAASTTTYFHGGASFADGAGDATETNKQVRMPVDGVTIRNHRTLTGTNGRTTDSTYRSRDSGANGAYTQVIAPTDDNIVLEDTTASDLLDTGDLFAFELVTGTGSGTLVTVSQSWGVFHATHAIYAIGGAQSGVLTTAAGATTLTTPYSLQVPTTGGNHHRVPFLHAFELTHFGINATALPTNDWHAKVLRNGVEVASVSGTGGTAGWQIATISTPVSFAANDDMAIEFHRASGGSGTYSVRAVVWAGTPVSGTGQTYQQALAGALTPAGAVTKTTARTHTGTLSPAGTVARTAARALTGVLTFSGALTTRSVFQVAVGGALSFLGATIRRPTKVMAGSLSPAGLVLKRIQRTVGGVLAPGGAVAAGRRFVQAVTGVLAPGGALVQNYRPGEGVQPHRRRLLFRRILPAFRGHR